MENCLLTDDFKKRMRERRLELGATLREVAKYLGVESATYWYWENGETRKCANVWHSRLKHFVEADIEQLRQEIQCGKMNNNEFYMLDGCLQVVTQVCNMVCENQDVINEYAKNVEGILVDAFTKHLAAIDGSSEP